MFSKEQVCARTIIHILHKVNRAVIRMVCDIRHHHDNPKQTIWQTDVSATLFKYRCNRIAAVTISLGKKIRLTSNVTLASILIWRSIHRPSSSNIMVIIMLVPGCEMPVLVPNSQVRRSACWWSRTIPSDWFAHIWPALVSAEGWSRSLTCRCYRQISVNKYCDGKN